MLLTLLSITPRVALEDLSLHRGLRTLQDTLAAVCLFPRLKALSLRARDNWERRLDLAVLKPLLALERFSCSGWQSVGLKGTPVLPQLSFLEISSTRSTAIDAALLSLHELWISQTRTLQLRGLHLRLPQLSKLSLYKVNMGAVSWPALPQLKSLTAVECPELTVAAPAELSHLASLTLHWSRDCWEAGGRWLHAAPSSLQHMSFYGSTNDWSQPPPLSSVTQLTSLSCNSPAIIPYLHPLAQLQQLELSMNSVTDITLEHSGWLCGLSSLRQLCFGYRVNCLDSAIERLKQALVELSLYGEERVVHDSLVAVQLFPRLRVLTLVLPDTDIGGRLNLRALQPLPALERLACGAWERVDLRGSTRLRQLTSLEIWDAGSVDIDATLPSLQELVVMGADTLGLTGKRLQLPQLTHLNLTFIDMVAVNWRALPQLAELLVASCEELNTVALPELGCLTSLSLDYGQHSESWQVADGILQAAPSSLLSLSITGLEEEEWLQPPMLSSMPQLTSLSSRSPAIIAQLGPLSRLQHLEFPWHSATDLSLEHLDCLCGLTSLRQLEFGITVRNRDAERRLEVLRRVLPPGCILDQPMRS
ncbi:hypothetical protein N2152v2_009675 [Parachlorella kessleri]